MKVEERIVSNLNSAQIKKAKGGTLVLNEKEKKRALDLLSMMKDEGLIAWFQFKDSLLEYELRYKDNISSFTKIVSVNRKKRWNITWMDLKKRERIRPVTPFRTSIEKKQKQAPAYETLILKTEKGWLTERSAFLHHTGGLVLFRIYTSL
jgi:ribosomal protein S8